MEEVSGLYMKEYTHKDINAHKHANTQTHSSTHTHRYAYKSKMEVDPISIVTEKP